MGRGQTTHRSVPMTRRDLLTSVPVALAAGSGGSGGGTDTRARPRIAAIVTEYRTRRTRKESSIASSTAMAGRANTTGPRSISFRSTSIRSPRTT